METTSKKVKDEGGGIHVFADNCLICNHQCYLPSKTDDLDRKRIIELRSLFYTVYEIPVVPSFVNTCLEDLPLCMDCTFKLGRLKVLHDQATFIHKEFVKLKEDIAFNIVDVVAGNNGDQFGSLEIWSKPPEVIQGYLKQSEVDTLQHIIFDEWHERFSTDLDDKFNINSFLPRTSKNASIKVDERSESITKLPNSRPQPKKITNRQSVSTSSLSTTRSPSASPKLSLTSAASTSSSITKNLINNAANATTSVKSDKLGRKTTVISITTHEGDEISRNKSPTSIGRKRKLESLIPEKEDKRSESIEIMVDDIKKERDEVNAEEDDDMVISMSPGQIRSSRDGYTMDENGFNYGNESDGEVGLEPDVQISRISQKRQSRHSEPDMELGNIYDNMSVGDMGHFLESGEGAEEEDPERQEYLANIIAQLQAGGNNIEFQQNEEGLYVCMFCNKTFIHKYPYRDHLKTHTGEGPRCPICNKIFPKNHNLMLHLRTHTGEKPFKCDVCNKGFADKSNLKVHYRVHTGEKPYKCDYCDQAFVNSSRLVVHRRLHTGERPFSCEFCGKSFSTSNQLAAHSKLHGFDQMDNSAEGYSNLM